MPVVKEVKWGQDNPIENAPVLSDEELLTLKNRMAALDKVLADQKKAKYKIELLFSYRRTDHGAFPGALSLWESGTKLHGGGDTKVYECPGRVLKMNDCAGIIPDASAGYGHLVCPACQKVWTGSQVFGEILARLTVQGWAQLVLKYYARLGHNADIYVKSPKLDLRKVAGLEQQKQFMGEKLTVARARRMLYIYPLKNIIKDVSNGADLLGRFEALLKA